MLRRRSRAKREGGQALVLFALSLVVILAFAALVVDIGVLRNDRQILVNTINSAALAGGTLLPVVGSATGTAETAANNLIDATVQADYPGLPLPTIANGGITYKCLIGTVNGAPALSQIPYDCNPGGALGHTPTAADFTGSGPNRLSSCDPSKSFNGVYDTCNVVVVTDTATTTYGFAPVVGINTGSTGAVQSTVCNGPCGQSPLLDLMIIMDRTASMSDTDVTNTVNAAESVLKEYNPTYERIALGLIGLTNLSAKCGTTSVTSGPDTSVPVVGTHLSISNGGANPADPTNAADVNEWIPVGLSGTDSGSPAPTFDEAYSTNGVLAAASASHLVATLSCYDHPGGAGTDLGTPLLMAQRILDADTRTGPNGQQIVRGIIEETDGQPDNASNATPASDFTCAYAQTSASTIKTNWVNNGIPSSPGVGVQEPITLYTIGFGMDTSDPNCPDQSLSASKNLAKMATQPSTDPGCPTQVVNGVNNGGDYFCEPKGGTTSLTPIFQAIAASLAAGLHLLNPYPTPIVSAVSPPSGTKTGNTSVTITGEFFTGSTTFPTSVTFGGTPAKSVMVNSDTSITAATPAEGTGVVNVQVTTAGGSSPITSADQYTFTSP